MKDGVRRSSHTTLLPPHRSLPASSSPPTSSISLYSRIIHHSVGMTSTSPPVISTMSMAIAVRFGWCGRSRVLELIALTSHSSSSCLDHVDLPLTPCPTTCHLDHGHLLPYASAEVRSIEGPPPHRSLFQTPHSNGIISTSLASSRPWPSHGQVMAIHHNPTFLLSSASAGAVDGGSGAGGRRRDDHPRHLLQVIEKPVPGTW